MQLYLHDSMHVLHSVQHFFMQYVSCILCTENIFVSIRNTVRKLLSGSGIGHDVIDQHLI